MNLESLQSRRTWVIGSVVVALLVAVAGWFLIVNPKLSEASDTRAAAKDNDFANTGLLAKHSTLVRQQRGIAELRAKLIVALAGLPATSALPEFTNEATQAATATSVTLSNIAVGSLTPVVSTAPATPAPAASASPSSAATSSAAPPAATTATATQFQVGITLSTGGPIENQLAFVRAIENGPRRALVTSTSFAGTGEKLTLTTQLNIFTAPMSAQQIKQLRGLLGAS